MSPARVGFLSFRLGGTDGVSIEAAKWMRAFADLGMQVATIAGSGPVDRLVEGLGIGAESDGPDKVELGSALADCRLVVVENLCSLPLNKMARTVTFDMLAKRPTIFHHHDLPWQREMFVDEPAPKDTAAWRHVVINDISKNELKTRGITAVRIYNSFDPHPVVGTRDHARAELRVDERDILVLQPTRAIERKNVAGGLHLAEKLGATYWLLGDPEDGYGDELKRVFANAHCPVLHRQLPHINDAYAAADVIAMPSVWEGFGNPTLESATFQKPLAVAPYPVAEELKRFGFRWFGIEDAAPIRSFLADPDPTLLEHNHSIAEKHFNIFHLAEQIRPLVADLLGATPAA